MAIKAGRERVPYAADPDLSRGRLYPEPASRTRNAFRRDCDRIIHAAAFRRLKHKTQVFVYHEGDHYRTRLTHTLEVTQIARSLARALGLDEDLAEALALAHDLGHPPFGHAGEMAIDSCLDLFGGFDHNAQSLRVVTVLERRYPDFDGLNLSWETLEGLIKHNGPLTDRHGNPIGRYRNRGVPDAIARQAAAQNLSLFDHATAEAQAAAIADDIAYDAHDIDDGLRADLFGLEDVAQVPLLQDILSEIRARYPLLDAARLAAALVRRLIARMIEDVIAEAERRFAQINPRSADDVRRAATPLVDFSETMTRADQAIKDFLRPMMYRHVRILRIMTDAQNVVRELFAYYAARPDHLPDEWGHDLDKADAAGRARRVADFIAGMTDRYALAQHARYFDSTPDLR